MAKNKTIRELALKGGAQKIFLYCKGKIDAKEDLAELLHYMKNGK